MRRETALTASPRAASLARAALEDEISSSALIARLDDARTVITEVVTNAVKYGANGQEHIRLLIDLDDERLHVRVEQPLPAIDVHPSAPQPDVPVVGGFGLLIVEALADGWGVEAGPPGCVWFQFEADDGST